MAERNPGAAATRAVFLAAGLVVIGLLFRELLTLLLAVLITVILAIPISAVADRLERRRVPRWLGALLALFAGVGVVVGVFALVIPSFVDQTNQFADNVPGILSNLRNQLHDATGLTSDEISRGAQTFIERYTENPSRLIGPLATISFGLAGGLAALALVLITAYYIALNPKPLIDGTRRLVPPAYRGRADVVMGRLRSAWVGWMGGVAIDMVLSGFLLWLGLSLIGLDFAIFFAVIAALLVVIPYFGAIAGGLPPFLFAFTDSPGKALLVFVIYVAVQQIESNVTIPLVMARAVRLHPAVIAIGVFVVGTLFGYLGLIVAVPILSLIVILVEEVWVRPMEEADRHDSPGPLGVPPSSRVRETLEV